MTTYIKIEDREEGKLYHQHPEGLIELTPAEIADFNARLAAHEAAQAALVEEQQPTTENKP